MSPDGSEELQTFQYNGVDYLYNLEPQQLNFFYPAAFFDPYDRAKGGSETSSYQAHSVTMPNKMEFRIQGISGFKLPSLTIDIESFNTGFRIQNVKKPKSENNLTINWIEDSYHTVKRYHMNWMNHWYNKYLDCMVCGRKGKYRNFAFYLFHYVNINDKLGSPIYRAKPIALFNFLGLVPENLGSMDMSYDDGGSKPVAINYKYNGLNILFYPYTENDKDYIGGMAQEIQDGLDLSSLKNTGIVKGTENSSEIFSGVTDAGFEKVYYI